MASSSSKTNNLKTSHKLFDLFWAKLEGYPWWPSIVCPNPTNNTYIKEKDRSVFIHVQFFDDPTSRAWIKLKDLKPFLGKDRINVCPPNKTSKDWNPWNQSVKKADKALKKSYDERAELIVNYILEDEYDIQSNEEEVGDKSDETSGELSDKSIKSSSGNKSRQSDSQLLDRPFEQKKGKEVKNICITQSSEEMDTEFRTAIVDMTEISSIELNISSQPKKKKKSKIEVDSNGELLESLNKIIKTLEMKNRALEEENVKLKNQNQELLSGIEEAKRNQWCRCCLKKSILYCCWNTTYCTKECQHKDWPNHHNSCRNRSFVRSK